MIISAELNKLNNVHLLKWYYTINIQYLNVFTQ